MAQEDDLRALGKVMDFMRGISVIFLLVNCYWFCYEAFHVWGFTLGIIDKILMNFQRTTGLFSSILWTKLFWLCLFLSQLVATGIAHRQDRGSFALYLHALHWLYLPVNGWRMDEPITQKQPDGRCV